MAVTKPRPPKKTVQGIASDVTLEPADGRAVKVYRRHPLIGALYRVAFQASFPYISNLAALKAAKYRREIAGLVTEYFLGRDVVAPVVAVETLGDRYAFITEFVPGGPPTDHKHAREFLHSVTEAFIQTGLPTWQVTPHNPKSLGNLMETPEGDYRIIDLESNVVTPMVPLSGAWGAARTAHLPPFDDIDMPRLLAWIERNRGEIERRLGRERAEDLIRACARYAWYERLWQGNELRLWSRGLRVLTRLLDIPAHLRRIGHWISGWRENAPRAQGWIEAGIARWEDQGRITPEQAVAARRDLEETETLAVLTHLGAHLTMSIPLRFPLGAIARFSWTAIFRLHAELRALVRRHVDARTRSARATHSLPVMAVAAVPGIGSAAYVLASPLRRNRVLMAVAMDQALRLLPFRMYPRLHLNGVTCAIASSRQVDGPTRVSLRTLPADLGRIGKSLGPYARTIALITSVGAATIAGSAVYYAATGSGDGFDELGPVSTLKLAESLLIALIGIQFYRRFWSRPRAETRPGAATSLFWPLAGLAIAGVAVDDFVQIHEWVFQDVTLLSHLVLVGYFVIGVLLVILFEREIRSSSAVFAMTAIGLFFVVATFAFDALVPKDGLLMSAEEVSHLCATTALLSAFAIRYQKLVKRLGHA